ncbi:hypothetical protein CHL76_01495 [Marinococcus halophilus]|uniref:Uncharacterized protein n=1 Tax=Marinococcus halophilus TaxID=1371 RepID=A0A510Y5E6_MARHA|nr:hypothetical protein [Marinococcus halophilus]OZT81794.1 hypothetical protein CHL76_01495 [Marinococcus halophilus]GEK57757.1 hypothetical protein MHA01_06620 [Marinococcus halophilus]
MSAKYEEQLQEILHEAVQDHNYDRAEQAVHYMRSLERMKAFIAGEDASYPERNNAEAVPFGENGLVDLSAPTVPFRDPHLNVTSASSAQNRDTLLLYYIEEEGLLKFKKAPQTYAVSVEFFRTFLQNLVSWENKSPFSSKDYFEAFGDSLKEKSTYQASTLRQFITLLFRYCVKLNILEKPEVHQRSRYILAEDISVEEVIDYIKEHRILQM